MPHRKDNPRIRRMLVNAIIVPLILMLLITTALIWQINFLLRESASVEHADRIMSKANELQKLTIDMETGLRGFLLTGEDQFLQPYIESSASIEQKEQQLRTAIGTDAESAELDQLTNFRKKWMEYAQQQIQIRRANGDYISVIKSLQGKQQIDQMRSLFVQLIDHESQVREVRFRDAERASRITLALVTGAGIGGGLLLAFLSRKQFQQVAQTYDAALLTAHDLNQTLEERVNQRTRDLEQRTNELTDLNRELEAFSYSISHDLRAPMRHIAGFANLLEKSLGAALQPDDKENLTTIHETARLAGKMVDDLLMFSRVGRTPMRNMSVDLNTVIADCRRDLTLEIADRHIDWTIHPLPSVAADPTMVKMVISNLIANAVKYTSKNEHAEIEIGPVENSAENSAENPGQLTCFIKDNGVGFDMAYADKLFGVFQRLHRSEEFEGTGIGLANVRRIIVRSGGKVWAKGQLGQGATFYFTLPIAMQDEP